MTGNDDRRNVSGRTQPYQILPGIGDAGHTGVGDDGTVFSRFDPRQNFFSPFPQIMLIIADHGLLIWK